MEETKVTTFSLVKKEIPVTLTDADGIDQEYIIKELDGRDRDIVLEEYTKNVTKGKDGEVKVGSIKGMMANLLAKTLYGPDGVLLKVPAIQAFPASASEGLYKLSAELNGFTDKKDEEEDDLGND